MTVAAELAEALHHIRGVGPAVPHEALRGRTPASSGRRRPSVLKEPEPPVVVEHAACPCSGAPLLAIPCLGGGADGVDVTTTRFLLQQALTRKKEEEEVAKQQEEKYEAKMKLLKDTVSHDLPLTEAEWAACRKWIVLVPSSSSSGLRRKRKKRRKRTLPKTSSHLTLRRAHRRQQQLYVHGWFCCFSISHTVFPSVVGRSQLPGIMDDSSLRALVFDPGSGICKAGFASFLALGSSTLSSGPR